MTIQKQIIVRYRIDGHVRFQIPSQLTSPKVSKVITEEISTLAGVYRVVLFRGQKKLSVRYQEGMCDFVELAKQIHQIISRLEKDGLFEKKNDVSENIIQGKIKKLKFSQWLGEKYTATKETFQAAKIITRLGLKKPNALVKDPEKAFINFFNDILVLYLIKVHWSRITQEWIPRPFVYRYEWTAVFYLFYLLIRSRRPEK